VEVGWLAANDLTAREGRDNINCGPIVVVEDDASYRTLLHELLRQDGYSTLEFESGENLRPMELEAPPGLVVLDVELPGMSGYELCRILRARFGPRLPVIFISGKRTESYDRVAGFLVGADDYIVKPFASDEFLARVRRLVNSLASVDSSAPGAQLAARLTKREREVLELLADGMTPREIAHELFISQKTVGTHIQRILNKLEVHSRSEAVAIAYREGLVTPSQLNSA
jgi:DNA-binding NarL/FixJ family response regulator